MRDSPSFLENMVIIKVTKRTMAAVMKKCGNTEKGLKQGRGHYTGETVIKSRIKMRSESPGDMHRTERVHETAMLCRGKNISCALKLEN
jgi:hypothetical protein